MSRGEGRESAEEMLGGGAPGVTHVQLTFEDESDEERDISCDIKEDCKSVDNLNTSAKCDSAEDGGREGAGAPRSSLVQKWLQGLDDIKTEICGIKKDIFNYKLDNIETEDNVELARKLIYIEPGAKCRPRPKDRAAPRTHPGGRSSTVTLLRKPTLNYKKKKAKTETCAWAGRSAGQCSLTAPLEASDVRKRPHETDDEWWERVKMQAYQRYRMLPTAPTAGGRKEDSKDLPAFPQVNVIKVRVKVPRDQVAKRHPEHIGNQTQPNVKSSEQRAATYAQFRAADTSSIIIID